MPHLPPPSGRPATMAQRSDPWEEQRQRERDHRLARRRRRRRRLWILLAVMVIVGLAAGAVFAFVSFTETDDSESTASTVTPPTTVFDRSPTPTVPPERLVEVSEVWLLDRGDDVYDWGLSVVVPNAGPTRSDVEVSVTLLDDRNDVVDTIVRTLDGVNSLVPSTAAGRVVDPEHQPVRLEFDITVGVPSDDLALDALLSTRAVRRDGDELTGRIRSSALDEITDISMIMVWRADADDASGDEVAGDEVAGDEVAGDEVASDADGVVAVVVYEIERIRPGVDAQFTIDLDEQRAPDGVPDDVLWSPTS